MSKDSEWLRGLADDLDGAYGADPLRKIANILEGLQREPTDINWGTYNSFETSATGLANEVYRDEYWVVYRDDNKNLLYYKTEEL
jgi:hypothetical protein